MATKDDDDPPPAGEKSKKKKKEKEEEDDDDVEDDQRPLRVGDFITLRNIANLKSRRGFLGAEGVLDDSVFAAEQPMNYDECVFQITRATATTRPTPTPRAGARGSPRPSRRPWTSASSTATSSLTPGRRCGA